MEEQARAGPGEGYSADGLRARSASFGDLLHIGSPVPDCAALARLNDAGTGVEFSAGRKDYAICKTVYPPACDSVWKREQKVSQEPARPAKATLLSEEHALLFASS